MLCRPESAEFKQHNCAVELRRVRNHAPYHSGSNRFLNTDLSIIDEMSQIYSTPGWTESFTPPGVRQSTLLNSGAVD